MAKKNGRGISPLTIVICVLVIVIFCVSAGITINRLAEYSRKKAEAERIEEQIGGGNTP